MLYLSVLKKRTEAVAQRCSFKKVFLEILQNWQENTCARVSFLMKLQVKANNFIKKETDTDVFQWVEMWLILPIFFLETVCTKNVYKPEYEW